jgi:hypothetical protein
VRDAHNALAMDALTPSHIAEIIQGGMLVIVEKGLLGFEMNNVVMKHA